MVSSSNFISFISVYTFGIFYFLIIHEYTISILLFNLFFDSNLKLALDDFFALGRQLKGNIFSDLLPIMAFLLRLVIQVTMKITFTRLRTEFDFLGFI